MFTYVCVCVYVGECMCFMYVCVLYGLLLFEYYSGPDFTCIDWNIHLGRLDSLPCNTLGTLSYRCQLQILGKILGNVLFTYQKFAWIPTRKLILS